jgi:hypothetical protein
MSRIDWITLNRAIRTLASMIVTTEIASPTTKPVATVDASNVNVRCSAVTSRPEPRIRSARHAISHPNPMPSNAPSALASIAYSQPSPASTPTRVPRRIPMARSIPSSERRSSASITNTLTRRRIPAATANIPIVK